MTRMSRLTLVCSIIGTVALFITTAIVLCLFNERINDNSQRLESIETGLGDAEQYLEPEYPRYLRGEITELWKAVGAPDTE